ncbi:hypothetical protein RBH29_05810 [Herbivorax sp. ANBcel31]|uniref:hypothetical protein n=1 Tax=Herbivorax sp. ANBcel31 TaxID=3069754 RepID=UPI0027B61ADE|nr:hypothetical protein [Herbivorax sp. ANBcel31]MDQ2085954.1 hypothetical protein [Herbivorax sp. ANBcel31]
MNYNFKKVMNKNASKGVVVLQKYSANYVAVFGDTCLLIQSPKGDWYFFQYTLPGVVLSRVNKKYLKSLEDFNKKYETSFDTSLYVKGDFNVAFKRASELHKHYKKEYYGKAIIDLNMDYKILSKNCTTVVSDLIGLGILDDGSFIKDSPLFKRKLFSRICSAIPNTNFYCMKNMFNNSAFSFQEFVVQLNEKKELFKKKLNNPVYRLVFGKSAKDSIYWIEKLSGSQNINYRITGTG